MADEEGVNLDRSRDLQEEQGLYRKRSMRDQIIPDVAQSITLAARPWLAWRMALLVFLLRVLIRIL